MTERKHYEDIADLELRAQRLRAEAVADASRRAATAGEVDVLVATEDTARGLDLDSLEHVVLLTVPKDATSYLHMSGRTGRMGQPGVRFLSLSDLHFLAAHQNGLEAGLLVGAFLLQGFE